MSSSQWGKWLSVEPNSNHAGCQVKMFQGFEAEGDSGWIHFLLAPEDEPDPRNNHIHIKYWNSVSSTPVLCGVTEDGQKSHSRKRLLERINEVTGLNLQYE